MSNPARSAAVALGAAAGIFILAMHAALAVEDGRSAKPVDPMGVPTTVHTGDPAARAPGGAADKLLAFVRERGRARVIVGVRFAPRVEAELSLAERGLEQRAQRAVEDAVLGRVFGATAAAEVDRYEIIPFMSVWVSAPQLARLLADPQVVSVEKDLVMEPALGESVPLIHADDVFAKGVNGTGFAVAVLDSGVAFKRGDNAVTNPMLRAKVVSEACFSTHQLGNGFTSTCPGAADTIAVGSAQNCGFSGCDHGTHVATIAAGNSSALDGVARDATIIAIKVATQRQDAACPSPCVAIFSNDVIAALTRVYDLRNRFDIAAVNMSITVRATLFAATCDATIPALTAIIAKLRDEAGIPSIVAAGNNGNDASVGIPACVSKAVAVGNTTKADQLSPTSNNAPLVDLFAPGSSIKAGVPAGFPCITPTSGPYCMKSGTSMAAPHVAGAFALLKNAKPAATAEQILQALKCSAKTVTHRLKAGGPTELDPVHGRIDVLGAYNFLLKPAGAVREWKFLDKSDVLDWTLVEGPWRHGAASPGTYELGPIPASGVGHPLLTALANCHSAFTLQIVFQRTDTQPFITASGFWLKALIDYKAHTISGYFFSFDKSGNPSTGVSGRASAQEIRNFAYRENIPCTQAGGCEVGASCTAKHVPISQTAFNTLKIVSTGQAHTYFMNGANICTLTDGTYTNGAIVPYAKVLPPFEPGQTFRIDSVKITLPGGGGAALAAAR